MSTIAVIALSLVLLLLCSGLTIALLSSWNNAVAISHALGRITEVDRRVAKLAGEGPQPMDTRTRPLPKPDYWNPEDSDGR